MSDMQAKIDREAAIRENYDPMGKKWGVTSRKGYGLYLIGHVTEDDRVKIPENYPKFDGLANMDGMFTTASRAQEAIHTYLNKAWDKYGVKEKHAAGKQRAKEQREAEKAEGDAAA